jgi:hypothetical protein
MLAFPEAKAMRKGNCRCENISAHHDERATVMPKNRHGEVEVPTLMALAPPARAFSVCYLKA